MKNLSNLLNLHLEIKPQVDKSSSPSVPIFVNTISLKQSPYSELKLCELFKICKLQAKVTEQEGRCKDDRLSSVDPSAPTVLWPAFASQAQHLRFFVI